jgi:hypothetical protein
MVTAQCQGGNEEVPQSVGNFPNQARCAPHNWQSVDGIRTIAPLLVNCYGKWARIATPSLMCQAENGLLLTVGTHGYRIE